MAIPVYLQKYKAAGIYRIVFDKSTIAGVDAEILRLVVGYSENGPFNTPVYITSVSEFTSIFGTASRKLEKRGIFFHRMAIQALASGPILALNLKKFSNEVVGAVGFNPNSVTKNFTDYQESAGKFVQGLIKVEDIYDTSRFWKLDENQLAEARFVKVVGDNSSIYNTNNFISGYVRIAATNTAELSNTIVLRKSQNTSILRGYDVTVRDWYSDDPDGVPEYLHGAEDEKIKDFFVDLYVFRGKFTNGVTNKGSLGAYIANAPSDTDAEKDYASCVDNITFTSGVKNAFGDVLDTLDQMYFDTRSNALAKYTGCTIPFFRDKNGVYQSIDILFNQDPDIHYMMMYLDTIGLENGDIEWTDIKPVETPLTVSGDYINGLIDKYKLAQNYLVMFKNIAGVDPVTDDTTLLTPVQPGEDEKNQLEKINKYVDAFAELSKFFNAEINIDYNKVEHGGATKIDLEKTTGANGKVSYAIHAGISTFESPELNRAVGNYFNLVKDTDCSEGTATITGYEQLVVDGVAQVDDEGNPIDDKTKPIYSFSGGDDSISKTEFTRAQLIFNNVINFNTYKDAVDALKAAANEVKKAAENLPKSLKDSANEDGTAPDDTYYVKDGDKYVAVPNGHYGPYTKVGDKYEEVSEWGKVSIYNYPTAYLQGYTFLHPLPVNKINGKPASDDLACLNWHNDWILKALVDYKGLRVGLCSKADIEYRYIIDTFQSYVTSSCKAILCGLAQEKQNAFAILNFPAVQTFKKYTGSTQKNAFIDANTKQFDVLKVTESSEFTLPSDAEGASFCAFYTPLRFVSGGIQTIVPSAALVSNNFMTKYTSRQPYYIVAGQNYGLIKATGLVGPDYNWSQDELQIIEPYGVNCMMYRPRVGTFINANQTAKQTPKSALSLVNIRELVIYLQDEIEKILQGYQWEFNTPELRAKILDRANYICQQVQNNGGLYDFLNVMDESNNTADIIDNEMCVLSTHIEPGKGCGKMIQELTIYRSGGMKAALSE